MSFVSSLFLSKNNSRNPQNDGLEKGQKIGEGRSEILEVMESSSMAEERFLKEIKEKEIREKTNEEAITEVENSKVSTFFKAIDFSNLISFGLFSEKESTLPTKEEKGN